MKGFIKVSLVCLSVSLAGCSTNPFAHFYGNQQQASNGQEVPVGTGTVPGRAIGGSVAMAMDQYDKVKLNHALDKAPGTPTTWVNTNSGVEYTVTPMKKLSVNGNPFCREYQVLSGRNGNQQRSTGTACVGPDGAWSEV